MKLRTASLAAVSLTIAAICTSLGVWQLQRLGERHDYNAVLAQRLAVTPVPLSALPGDTSRARYRRARFKGTYDYGREFVLMSRTRQGSPGVNIITPVRVQGSDTAVLVNRGWVYAPDGMSVDLRKWREGDSVEGIGYVATYHPPREGKAASDTRPGALRWLDYAVASTRVPYPLAPYHLVLAADTTPIPRDIPLSSPPRLPPPLMDEGPHRSYAFQWFSFAAISILGTYLLLRRK